MKMIAMQIIRHVWQFFLENDRSDFLLTMCQEMALPVLAPCLIHAAPHMIILTYFLNDNHEHKVIYSLVVTQISSSGSGASSHLAFEANVQNNNL